jgi:hypothetical protein
MPGKKPKDVQDFDIEYSKMFLRDNKWSNISRFVFPNDKYRAVPVKVSFFFFFVELVS